MKYFPPILCILFLSACVIEQQIPTHLLDTGKPALHAVQSKRLKSLMDELNDLMFERMMNEVQIDQQRRYRTAEIVTVVDELIKTVQYIPSALDDLTLGDKEQQIFLRMSSKLKQQLDLLKQDAENNHVDAISNRANQIIATCNACHHIFRQKNN